MSESSAPGNPPSGPPGPPGPEELTSDPVFPHLRWLIPVHVLLPVLIGAALTYGGELGATIVGWTWLALHLAFPAFLGLTYPFWRGRGEEVALMIVITHAVTFTVGAALMSWW